MFRIQPQLSYLWDTVRVSSWIIPFVMSLLAVLLALSMLALDQQGRGGLWGWAEHLSIDGAGVRQVVSVTTGAMMTITGVVFSVSVVVLTLASNQFGPKVLRNYLRETGNKVVLGLFVATFIYGLIVLASVDTGSDRFVPFWSMLLSVGLTLLAMGGLIYFIHNISTEIQADRIIARIGEELDASIDRILVSPGGGASSPQGCPGRQAWPARSQELPVQELRSPQSGYIQSIDYAGLAMLACEFACLLEVTRRAGHFVIARAPLVRCFCRDDLSDQQVSRVFEHVMFGRQRTPVQDIEFSIEQLVQMAQRALSPGINDSLTAITCIDWLSAALGRMSVCEFPGVYFCDGNGALRVSASGFSFQGAVEAAFDPLRQSARGNEMVTIRLLESLCRIMSVADQADYRAMLFRQADLIHRSALESIPSETDRDAVGRRFGNCRALLDDGPSVPAGN